MKKIIVSLGIVLGLIVSVNFAYAIVDTTPPVIPAPTETFIIRSGSNVIYTGSVPLPVAGSVSINDDNGVAHTVDARSVLAILNSIDEADDSFSISDLQFFTSFGGAFYLKCITASGPADCDNWQYAVGSLTPFSSIDQTILSGGETVGIYFGNSHQVVFDKTSIPEGGTLTTTAEMYDYQNDVWNPLTGVSIGVTLPNPANPFSPTIVSKTPVDASGKAVITIGNANTYTLGIDEDFYFPSYDIIVSPVSNGSGAVNTAPYFNIPNAIAYLKSVQASDGSFGGSDLYTDWVAVAFGAGNVNDSSRDKLLSYINTHNTISSLVTDNERRAIALLSLGQNPYSFNGTNYISAIIKSFDGTQFGDKNLANDDIFALIPLASAGYTASDDIIIKDIAFILGAQRSDGSWDESTDITGAAIQALRPFDSISGVSSALSNASNYLENSQSGDGSWSSSVSSTSWVLQGMASLGVSWTKNNHTGVDYLATQQTTDGAVSPLGQSLQNRIWATSYAIPAASSKSWSSIMIAVSKPATQNNGSDGTIPDTNSATTKKNSPDTTTDSIVNNTPAAIEMANANTNTPPVNTQTVTNNENSKIVAINNPVTNKKSKKPKTQLTLVPKTNPTQSSTENKPEDNSIPLTANAIDAVPITKNTNFFSSVVSYVLSPVNYIFTGVVSFFGF